MLPATSLFTRNPTSSSLLSAKPFNSVPFNVMKCCSIMLLSQCTTASKNLCMYKQVLQVFQSCSCIIYFFHSKVSHVEMCSMKTVECATCGSATWLDRWLRDITGRWSMLTVTIVRQFLVCHQQVSSRLPGHAYCCFCWGKKMNEHPRCTLVTVCTCNS